MAKSKKNGIEQIVKRVEDNLHSFEQFHASVEIFFQKNPLLKSEPPTIHSLKGRIKDVDHLREKIIRKQGEKEITYDNVFETITDIAGIRVLHLYQSQFKTIHDCIMKQVNDEHWVLFEEPKAYSWDPTSVNFFSDLGLQATARESLYTSVHYVVKPRHDSFLTCEIQVRTLFEEVWGEIEHRINYPYLTDDKHVRDQIGVLARLVGAGSRLADSIFESSGGTGHTTKKKQRKKTSKKVSKK